MTKLSNDGSEARLGKAQLNVVTDERRISLQTSPQAYLQDPCFPPWL